MNNENISSCLGEPNGRITRARAKALGSSGQLYPSAKQGDKVSRTNAKRAASGSAACRKKRAVLKDVTNIRRHNADTNCINSDRDEQNKRDKEGSLRKKAKVLPSCLAQTSRVSGDKSENIMHDTNGLMVDEIGSSNNFTFEFVDQTTLSAPGPIPMNANPKDRRLCKKDGNSDDKCVIDIDSKHNDPQMCSLYAADIYYNMYTTQLARRPLVDYIEKVQRDITQDMRAILIDWLVEVSDEYKMASDTLYLTVNLIDRFLSNNYIEKLKLQLLGVTCMLIAT
ncbi:cyclin-a2-4 [Phtheirospermum japonicum]|uniref:Cyclin-a2-4 n=1 Tax=Phtheirospermum japonicum TaxID=374723 RepID=A0A830B1K0_9LAMI|nr:cyclin-a2-4 [Phtheirospermum japonicum]